ncbi:alpha-1-inhibitor 3-like [Convolutriloba macropyga]|uniref:alpha-1-inhibitor 3-like n=1 Tax=Convolutriloba macropyga TaxID=536237 RepID=UPI003F51F417
MLLMAPTVYVMRYLNARQESRPELRQKALEYIQVGYSRELQYKHPDGSFSAFGTSDDSGSTWLTAFVLKVFSQAHGAQLVEVDQSIAHTAAKWLVNTAQSESGQFQPKGRVIHSEMVGGVTDDKASVSLTAFVTGALLEAHKAGLLPADAEGGLSAALQYLMDAAHDTNYAKVLVAHTLTMAAAQESQGLPVPPGLAAAAAAALDDMQAIAVTEGTMTHWAPKEQPSSDDDKAVGERCSSCYVAHAGGPEVEMTGYAMSTMITALGEDALADGFPVAKWLLSERSPTGGWRSTQDTTVALEGLSAYGALSSASPPDMTVTVRYTQPASASRRRLKAESVEKTLTLNAGNYDVLQVLELPVGQEVDVTVEGSGKAIMTVGTVWHTRAMPSEPTFLVRSSVGRKEGSSSLLQKVDIERVQGSGEGMVIGAIQLFSGMVPRESSLKQLKESKYSCNGAVKRVDYANDEISVYIDSLKVGDAPCELEVEMDREVVVENLKPTTVEVYEYYEPVRNGATETSPDFTTRVSLQSSSGACRAASDFRGLAVALMSLLAAAMAAYL